jgi:DNA invertase Pin-like site-specific DNA recombinase
MAAESKARLACAIYTRKSTEEGLEQEFNTLDAQREACEAYVLSQRHEGWRALDTHYDDGGFSGGNMERPALQQLLDDVRSRKVSVIVVYKVDRLTRSLSDFAKIVEIFDTHNVSFVSVTQQFNTTTSMGRLTLNVLLSFAQFEREITGERIRDKIAASRKKGMWMGGSVPLGYDPRDHKLVINPAEAKTVRTIFELYAEHCCVRRLKEELDRRQLISKRVTSQTGRTWGGRPFGRGQLYYILKNRLYIGEAVHKGQSYPGQHEAIVDLDLWDRVQSTLTANRRERSKGVKFAEPSLLAGILFDDRGNRLSPSHTQRHGRRYRYYVCQAILQHQPEKVGALRRLPAQEIERVVQDQVLDLLRTPNRLIDALASSGGDLKSVLATAAKEHARKWAKLPSLEQRSFLRAVLSRIIAGPKKIEITVDVGSIAKELLVCGMRTTTIQPEVADLIRQKIISIDASARLKRSGRETRMITEVADDHERSGKPNRALIKMLVRAFDWFEQFQTGRSTQQIADALGINRSYVAQIMPLVFLSPAIVADILDGRHADVKKFSRAPSVSWDDQRNLDENP